MLDKIQIKNFFKKLDCFLAYPFQICSSILELPNLLIHFGIAKFAHPLGLPNLAIFPGSLPVHRRSPRSLPVHFQFVACATSCSSPVVRRSVHRPFTAGTLIFVCWLSVLTSVSKWDATISFEVNQVRL
jgi:hypothetical protein